MANIKSSVNSPLTEVHKRSRGRPRKISKVLSDFTLSTKKDKTKKKSTNNVLISALNDNYHIPARRKKKDMIKVLSSSEPKPVNKMVETKKKELNKPLTSANPDSTAKNIQNKKKESKKSPTSSEQPEPIFKNVETKKKVLKKSSKLIKPDSTTKSTNNKKTEFKKSVTSPESELTTKSIEQKDLKESVTPSESDSPSKDVETLNNYLNVVLTPDEKVALLLQNGSKLKKKFSKSIPLNDGKINKSALSIVKDQIITKSGYIKKKSKDHLKLMDKLLMSELMITETNLKKKSVPLPISPQYQGVDNNNCDAISDQNKSGSEQSAENSPQKHKKKKPTKITESSDLIYKELSIISEPKELNSEENHPITSSLTYNSNTKQSETISCTTVNPSLFTFQCDYCNKFFSQKSSLQRHIYLHLDMKPFSCTFCVKTFRQKSNLKVHLKRRHLDKTRPSYFCSDCDKGFTSKQELRQHLATHLKNETTFRCVYCDIRFPKYSQLIQHEKVNHLVSGRYHCSICNMSYKNRSRLSLHVKSHLNIKEHVCHHCGKDFVRPNSIRRHIDFCHGGQRIQCPICKKMLKGHLTEHLRTHEKMRPHVCPECGQRFTQSTQLTVHRRSHSGVRPYPCRICDRPFTHSNALMLHIRRHTGEKPFACAMCPIFFSQLPHMKTHMNKIHGKVAAYKCSKCDLFFKLKTELEDHERVCTKGMRELTFEESIEASVAPGAEVDSVMSLSRMRFLLALLFTMIASKDKLKCLGFNKRLIDDLLVDSLKAMGQKPCNDMSLTPIRRLRINIQTLLDGTVPEDQMSKFREENKTTEELLVLLTDEKKK